MKTIVAIYNSENKGKTETIREIAKELQKIYSNFNPIFPIPSIIPVQGDFRLIIQINGKVIGLESQGDPNTDLEKRLEELIVNYKCDLIFCATRTRGDTVHSVENIANSHGCDIIWDSTYQTSLNQTLVNQLKAKHLVDLIQHLNLI